jgi:hypothetical protein
VFSVLVGSDFTRSQNRQLSLVLAMPETAATVGALFSYLTVAEVR